MAIISCMETANSAWRKMVTLLFKPFNFAKWLTLGFCVWLTQLGEGGSSGNFNFNSFKGDHGGNAKSNESVNAFLNALNQIFNGDSGNFFTRIAEQCHIPVSILAWICAGIALLIIIIIAVYIILTWLKARFEFILIDNLIYDRTDIVQPWKKYKTPANSAFVWLVAVGLITSAIVIIMLIFGFISTVPWIKSCLDQRTMLKPGNTMIISLAVNALLLIIFSLFVWLINFFFREFVIPVMYWNNLRVIEAWKIFLALLSNNRFLFFKYIILTIVFTVIAGAAILLAGLATCCIGLILLAIPFVGTVLILPVSVFFRLFGLELLAQFGPEFNIPPPPPEPEDIPPEPLPEPPSDGTPQYRW